MIIRRNCADGDILEKFADFFRKIMFPFNVSKKFPKFPKNFRNFRKISEKKFFFEKFWKKVFFSENFCFRNFFPQNGSRESHFKHIKSRFFYQKCKGGFDAIFPDFLARGEGYDANFGHGNISRDTLDLTNRKL